LFHASHVHLERVRIRKNASSAASAVVRAAGGGLGTVIFGGRWRPFRSVLTLVREADSRLNQLTLQIRRPKLLPIRGDPRLTRVDRTLHRGDQARQFLFNFRFPDVIEVRVSESLLASESVGRVHLEQANHQLESLFGERGHVTLFESFGLCNFGELQTDEARVFVERLHLFLGQGPEHLLNKIELVHFGVAWEEGLAVTQLAHNAPDGPHVDFGAVVGVAQQELWRTVPPSGHIVCHLATF